MSEATPPTDTEIFEAYKQNLLDTERISGKTVAEWKAHFDIQLPEQPDPELCKMLDSKVMNLHHEATYYMAAAQLLLDRTTLNSELQYRASFGALVQRYAENNTKLPSAETLKVLAHSNPDLLNTEMVRERARSEVSFWRVIKADLDVKRSLIKDSTINNGVQAKLDLANGVSNGSESDRPDPVTGDFKEPGSYNADRFGYKY